MLEIIGTVAGFVLLLVCIVMWSSERSRSQAKG
ncbi:hypothetical protein JOE66_001519 [Subtercola frigoramans]|uniref:Uncharacterized protein n=1 Tax=Subtercola frigoramans TaxID=120298 RepID=A0ABS2L460_9MICO|nr:hypothetical protein [Subtercola frigoramans]